MGRTALVVGSGPNGLSAAIVLAKAGFRVTVCEASERIGGAASSAALTLPGFVHDVGSAVHPLAVASPFFSSLELDVDWIHPTAPLAHPLDGGAAAMLYRDVEQTAFELGVDLRAWTALFGPLVRDWEVYRHELLSPLGWTNHPLKMLRLGINAALPASLLTHGRFQTERARALFTGLAAHSPFLDRPLSAGFGLVLGAAAQSTGWPIPRGGAQSIANALARKLAEFGGTVHTGSAVTEIDPDYDLVLADTSPGALARISGGLLPDWFRRKLERFRHGPGAFKMDWALSQPVPWAAAQCRQAGTVHLGGAASQVAQSERAAVAGEISDMPFLLLSQPTLFDATRAPKGKHIAWAYCHVPAHLANGSTQQIAASIERQIERFAPGFSRIVLAKAVTPPELLERQNANLVGGDATGGVSDIAQTLFRPTWRRYRTPNPKIWICSASTPPGAGVHGMCGFHAATQALASQGIRSSPPPKRK